MNEYCYLTCSPWLALLSVLFPMASSAYFFIPFGITFPGVTLPIVGWARPYQILIKKCHTGLPVGQSSGYMFSMTFSFFQDYSSLCQGDSKLTNSSHFI